MLGSVEIIPQQMGIGGAPLFTQCSYDKYHFLYCPGRAFVCIGADQLRGSCDAVSEELGGVCAQCIAMGYQSV